MMFAFLMVSYLSAAAFVMLGGAMHQRATESKDIKDQRSLAQIRDICYTMVVICLFLFIAVVAFEIDAKRFGTKDAPVLMTCEAIE